MTVETKDFEIKLHGKTKTLVFETEPWRPEAGRYIARNATANKFKTGKKVWGGDVEVMTVDIDRYVRVFRWTPSADQTYCYRFTCHHLNRNDSNIHPIGWADEIGITAR